jgi:hypothetical protein
MRSSVADSGVHMGSVSIPIKMDALAAARPALSGSMNPPGCTIAEIRAPDLI